MATTFFIRTTNKTGFATLFARVQRPERKIDIKQSSTIQIDIQRWKSAQKSAKSMSNFLQENPQLSEIIRRLDLASSEPDFNADVMKNIIRDIVYAEEINAEKKRLEEEGRKSLMQYYKGFLEDIISGKRVTEKGFKFAPLTVKHFNQGYNKLVQYQETRGIKIDWPDINMDFYSDYTAFLREIGYSVNTIGTRIKELKAIIRHANEEGIVVNDIYKNKKFRILKEDTDAIYLTEEELKKMRAVDISDLPLGYQIALDTFCIGVYTAQRVSDYNSLCKDNLKIIGGKTYVEVIQKKTRRKVIIPAKSELTSILEKYFELPRISEQKLNEYIKEIAKRAGLTDLIEIASSKGGERTTTMVPKYRLVHSHTARRTGATWMYLADMDKYDIMKITGHSSTQMLDKYIKASELEVIKKVSKAEYFK